MDLLLLKDFFELLDLEKSTHVNVTTYSTHLVKVLCIGYWKKKKKKKSDESYGHLKPSAACRCVSAGVEIYAEILPRAVKAPPW